MTPHWHARRHVLAESWPRCEAKPQKKTNWSRNKQAEAAAIILECGELSVCSAGPEAAARAARSWLASAPARKHMRHGAFDGVGVRGLGGGRLWDGAGEKGEARHRQRQRRKRCQQVAVLLAAAAAACDGGAGRAWGARTSSPRCFESGSDSSGDASSYPACPAAQRTMGTHGSNKQSTRREHTAQRSAAAQRSRAAGGARLEDARVAVRPLALAQVGLVPLLRGALVGVRPVDLPPREPRLCAPHDVRQLADHLLVGQYVVAVEDEHVVVGPARARAARSRAQEEGGWWMVRVG